MDFLRSLSARNPRIRQFLYSFLILIPILGVFHFCCLRLGSLDLFHNTLWKMAFCLGGRALSFFLIKIGCSGGLVLAIVFVVRALFTTGEVPFLANMMMDPGEDSGGNGSGASSSNSKQPYIPDLNIPSAENIEYQLLLKELEVVMDKKRALADLIRPLIEEESTQYQSIGALPSPMEMVEMLIRRSGIPAVIEANAPEATRYDLKHIKAWLTRARKSAEEDGCGNMSIRGSIRAILYEKSETRNN